MSYTFPQMMSELDPNFQFNQFEIDVCYYTHNGTFGTHLHLGDPNHNEERNKIKQDLNNKIYEVRQDVTTNKSRPRAAYADDIISKLTFPATAYIAVYPV